LLFLTVAIGLFLTPAYTEIKNFETRAENYIIQNAIVLAILLIISAILVYIAFTFIRNIFAKIKEREGRVSHIHWSTEDHLEGYYSINPYKKKNMTFEEFILGLEEKIKEASGFEELDKDKNRWEIELSKAKKELIARKKQEELDYQRALERREEKRLEEIELERRRVAHTLEWNRKQALKKLIRNNRIFKRDSLSKKQCKSLIEAGFKQVNEYCVLEKKRIPILARPFGNHTISHEFLVWSSKRLLRKIKEIKKIREHLTRDADITFEFDEKVFALEIERGDLLWKKDQLKEKIIYLNKKYPKRWMFVVSNRNFLAKYKKFGFTTPRNRMSENLQKLLKIRIHIDA